MPFHPVGPEWPQGSCASDPFSDATDVTGSATNFESLCPQGTSFPEKPPGSPKKFFNYTGISALRLRTLCILLLKQTMWNPVTKRMKSNYPQAQVSPDFSQGGVKSWPALGLLAERAGCGAQGNTAASVSAHCVPGRAASRLPGKLETFSAPHHATRTMGELLPPIPHCLVRSPWCPLSHRAEGWLESHAVACGSKAATCNPEGR